MKAPKKVAIVIFITFSNWPDSPEKSTGKNEISETIKEKMAKRLTDAEKGGKVIDVFKNSAKRFLNKKKLKTKLISKAC
ncbi:hypothetical protein [Lactobacillus nasalidis]|uniref:hypothetical protein n=1 Tax=Lactobacillus nasalidis TaxID=2797258 RepID=UPI0019156AC4|nr:hypothetical protein [Lactobacillus nasalidis]